MGKKGGEGGRGAEEKGRVGWGNRGERSGTPVHRGRKLRTQQPRNRVDPPPLVAGCRLPLGSEGGGVSVPGVRRPRCLAGERGWRCPSGQREGQRGGLGPLVPSCSCCEGRGRVGLGCFPGLFYKKEEKKRKSPAGETRMSCNLREVLKDI